MKKPPFTILIASEHKDTRDSSKDFFYLRGHQIETVTNLTEIQTILPTRKFDLLIVNHNLLGENIDNTFKQIDELTSKFPNLVIAITCVMPDTYSALLTHYTNISNSSFNENIIVYHLLDDIVNDLTNKMTNSLWLPQEQD